MRQNLTLILLLLASGAMLSQGGSARSESSSVYIPRTQIYPCDNWYMDVDILGYVCRSRPRRMEVVEAADVDVIVSEFERRISDLEERLLRLESR